jgi:Icc-related predicted phosphoesterase
MSDLHLDHDKVADQEFMDALQPQPDIGLLVLAGDWFSICRPQQTEELFTKLLRCYDEVLVVPGNHDYWRADPVAAEAAMRPTVTAPNKLHVLVKAEFKTVKGVPFFGGTMWYPQPAPRKVQHFIDMRQVHVSQSWFFEQYRAFEKALDEARDAGGHMTETVVVTHHLPHPESTPLRFRRTPNDHFFMTNMTSRIMDLKPKLWLHGHTHDACDYVVGSTRIVCNPRGYPFEYTARAPYEPKLIEV